MERLEELEPYAEDADFRDAFAQVKQRNKTRLANLLRARDGIELPQNHLLDVMVKRLHEYKRQSLKILHIVTLYEQIISGKVSVDSVTPRTVVFGAKAAPGYKMAKDTIHLINKVAQKVNAAPELEGRLKVAFPANFNVTMGQIIYPGAELSEQISLAGKEASGTGNMKFALNGALTIGTEDGANVEIRRLVGNDHFFLFGMLEPEVAELQAQGYRPHEYYEANPQLKATLDLIASGHFSGGDRGVFEPLVSNLLYRRTPLAKYATAMLVSVDVAGAANGRLGFTNAGHNPALLVRADGAVERLGATGPPIGLLAEAKFTQQERTLAPGDLLVLYTDGIVEACDPDDEEFGIERLEAFLVALRGAPLDAVAEGIDQALEKFVRGVPYADDRTLVLLRREGAVAAG